MQCLDVEMEEPYLEVHYYYIWYYYSNYMVPSSSAKKWRKISWYTEEKTVESCEND